MESTHVERVSELKAQLVFMRGQCHVSFSQAVVQTNCARLLSERVMCDWDVELRLGRNARMLNRICVARSSTEDNTPVIVITYLTGAF